MNIKLSLTVRKRRFVCGAAFLCVSGISYLLNFEKTNRFSKTFSDFRESQSLLKNQHDNWCVIRCVWRHRPGRFRRGLSRFWCGKFFSSTRRSQLTISRNRRISRRGFRSFRCDRWSLRCGGWSLRCGGRSSSYWRSQRPSSSCASATSCQDLSLSCVSRNKRQVKGRHMYGWCEQCTLSHNSSAIQWIQWVWKVQSIFMKNFGKALKVRNGFFSSEISFTV